MRRSLLALVILLGAQTLAVAQTPLAPSFWRNNRGSTLELKWAEPGFWEGAPITRFGGTFINHAQGFQCQGIPYDAHGRTDGDHVTFKVYFSQCDTLTKWSGYFRHRKMYTTWNLTYWVNGQPHYLNGADVFSRIR